LLKIVLKIDYMKFIVTSPIYLPNHIKKTRH